MAAMHLQPMAAMALSILLLGAQAVTADERPGSAVGRDAGSAASGSSSNSEDRPGGAASRAVGAAASRSTAEAERGDEGGEREDDEREEAESSSDNEDG